MTLSTLIHSGLVRPDIPRTALVLMGGGARTAYQAGALQAMGEMLGHAASDAQKEKFPFQLLVGTSAGALNASFLTSRAQEGLVALSSLAQFWQSLRSAQVYRLHVPHWMRLSRLATAWHLARQAREQGALLDNLPLADTLHKSISLQSIDHTLAQGEKRGAVHALAVTASSYTSGVHWTFCHSGKDSREQPWQRPGRRAEFGPITMEHLMASSAIPLLFPAQQLWVDGRSEFFGDGSMRQTSPLSPALHLGAHKVLVIGVGQPERGSLGAVPGHPFQPPNLKRNHPFAGIESAQYATESIAPGVGGVLGHALASVFHDTLRGDVEQAQRMYDTLDQLPREVAAVLPYKRVQVMSLQPSQSLDALALEHAQHLPAEVRSVLQALAGQASGKGASGGGVAGAALVSYLLFEPSFTLALMALGQRDAYANKEALMAFFAS
ncbi:MAG: patatin-like phospholipase family protein [Brachymonas sp.]